ncbi:MAG TPA: redoxin domain-containing protein [Gaiellaceae bacterium]|jgi:hypothetical protein|nr:redoxin domain-containing protein [Gaiellaceae bacterium]
MSGPWIAAFAALWGLVIVIGLVVLGTLRRLTGLLERAEESLRAAATISLGGLWPGTTVPPFASETVEGDSFGASDLDGDQWIVLFLSSACQACEPLVEDLKSAAVPDLGSRLVVVAEDAGWARELARARSVSVLVDEDGAIARMFDIRVVPQAFVIDEARTVLAAGRPNSWDGLRDLQTSALNGGGRLSEISATTTE